MDIQKLLDMIQEYLKKPLIVGAVCLVIGVLIGWLVIGWGIWPVEWTDASPSYLREDLKTDYMQMMVEAYAFNQDPTLAFDRWRELGDQASDVLQKLQDENIVDPEVMYAFSMLVGEQYTMPAQITGSETQEALIIPTNTADILQMETETSEGTSKINPLLLLGILFGLMLIVGGALFYLLVIRKKPGSFFTDKKPARVEKEYGYDSEYMEEIDEAPISQFMTTYMIGDDLYDDSFSIDSPSGEFLGECGVGISETIGVGDPKKVTAFEVWLFDKNDIQTVTKVIMSEHAFNDPNINQRLMSKGEPVVAESGKQIILETATLQLEARIVEMNYGQGALPENSYIDRFTLELAVWPKV